jgi:hypothetical protein
VIGLSENLERSRLAGPAGGVLPVCEQKFALELKEAGFDGVGATKSPQQACQSMRECKLDDGSRVNAANEGTLERPVGSNTFKTRNDGLVGKPVTPGAAS